MFYLLSLISTLDLKNIHVAFCKRTALKVKDIVYSILSILYTINLSNIPITSY